MSSPTKRRWRNAGTCRATPNDLTFCQERGSATAKTTSVTPPVALTIGGDCNSEGISSGVPASRNTIADVIDLYNVKGNKVEIALTPLEDDKASSFSPDKTYRALLFDTDYFADKRPADLIKLVQFVRTHKVKVGIVTTLKKPDYTRWLCEAPLPVEAVVGGGDIRLALYKFLKKPDPRPTILAVERLGVENSNVLSVCTKVIDRDSSTGAGFDIIVNSNPVDLIALLSQKS